MRYAFIFLLTTVPFWLTLNAAQYRTDFEEGVSNVIAIGVAVAAYKFADPEVVLKWYASNIDGIKIDGSRQRKPQGFFEEFCEYVGQSLATEEYRERFKKQSGLSLDTSIKTTAALIALCITKMLL